MKPIFLMVMMLFALAAVPSAFAADVTVCSSGCDHTTIQAAINAASDGDLVLINESGIYDEQLTVTKDVDVYADVDGVVLQPSGSVVGFDVFLNSSDVGLWHMILDFNGAADNRSGKGIVVYDGYQSVIRGCDIYGGDGAESVITFPVNSEAERFTIDLNEFYFDNSGGTDGVVVNAFPNTDAVINIRDNMFYGNISNATAVWIKRGNVGLQNLTINSNVTMGANGILVSTSNSHINNTEFVALNITNFDSAVVVGHEIDYGYVYMVNISDSFLTGNNEGIRVAYTALQSSVVAENVVFDNTNYNARSYETGKCFFINNWWGESPPDLSKIVNITFFPFCIVESCAEYANIDYEVSGNDVLFVRGTTDFNALNNWTDIPLVMENNHGKIEWLSVDLSASNFTLKDSVGIYRRGIDVATGSGFMPELDAPATLTFYGFSFYSTDEFTVLYQDTGKCPDSVCTSIRVLGGFPVVDVVGFALYNQYYILAGIEKPLVESGEGLGGFLDAINNPLINLILGLGIAFGVLAIVYALADKFGKASNAAVSRM